MGNQTIQTRRNPTNKSKHERQTGHAKRMLYKKLYNNLNNSQKDKPNRTCKLFMDRILKVKKDYYKGGFASVSDADSTIPSDYMLYFLIH